MPDRPPFPIPENKTPETCCLCIQMPQDETWKAVIAGLLFQPAEWFNWQRDEEKSGKELAQYWRKIYEQIDWSIMSCCCNDIPLSRFTTDGHYQVSNDGGATWTDAPEQDPRNSAPQLPPALPPGTVVPECTYADSVVNFFKDGVIDVIEEGDTVQQIVAIIGGILAAVFGAGGVVLGVIGALIAAFAAGIIGLGVTAVKNAFTEDVWDDLRCLIYKNINDDGSLSQEQVDTIYDNVPGDTIAQTVLRSWIAALGMTGLTNTARLLQGSADADCSSCDECGVRAYIPTGGGTELSWDDATCTITVESFYETGHYACYLWYDNPGSTYDPTKCGKIMSITVLTGAIDAFGGYNECTTGTLHFPALSIIDICSSQSYIVSSVPFTAEIVVAPC